MVGKLDHQIHRVSLPQDLNPKEIWEHFQDSNINRWAFRNIDKFAPHNVIQKSDSPLHLPRDLRNLNSIKFSGSDGETLTVSEALEYLITDCLVIVQDDVIIVEQYFEGMKPETPHLLFSASKPFAAFMIANLIANGYIKSEDDPVIHYLPELEQTAFFGVTIRHLLDMQSGVDFRALDDLSELERACGFAPPRSDENILSLALKLNIKKFPAGEMTDYNSINTDILSLLATRVTGQNAATLIQETIFGPMGAEFNALLIKDPQGINELGGGLATTALDLIKLGLAMINDGALNNRQVIPPSTIKKILNTAEQEKWEKGWLSSLTPQAKAYRFHIYLCSDNFDEGAYFVCGNYGNALYVNPKNRTVAALLCSYPTGVDIQRFNIQMALLREITNIR